MGTRALVHVKSGGRDSDTLVTIYRQFDGYPTGLGDDIKSVLGGKKLVNGYSNPANQVNGMGCAAAMLIAGIKTDCGNVYIYPANSKDVWEDYTYTLFAQDGAINLECVGHGDAAIYSGTLDSFDGEKVEQAEPA